MPTAKSLACVAIMPIRTVATVTALRAPQKRHGADRRKEEQKTERFISGAWALCIA
jgi:hypothetical protein